MVVDVAISSPSHGATASPSKTAGRRGDASHHTLLDIR